MSDAADPDRADDDVAEVATSLLELQHLDTEADQLRRRFGDLAERAQLLATSEALNEWERVRAGMRQRMDELGTVIETSETRVAEIATHKTRLQAQLKTVIAPREAEALMHEIEVLDEQTDELETTELEALEEQSDIDDRLNEHLRSESSLRDAVTSADLALQRATGEIDAELARLDAERDERREPIDAELLQRYDRVRNASGVAVARLVGTRCDGCHLDLSAAEVDDVKDQAAASSGLADCPNCGRILVV